MVKKNFFGRLHLSYWLRLVRFFLFTLILLLLASPLLLGLVFTFNLIYPPCAQSGQTPADYGFDYQAVTLTARAGGAFKGYFVPGTNGAAIIVPPAFNGGADSRLREAMLLAQHGYTLFTFESRRCAGMGGLSLGYKEVDEVADALDYLLTRPEVNPDRIGVHGFSSAGATAIMAAARLPQLRGVVAEGGYGDFAEETLALNPHSSGVIGWFEWAFSNAIKLFYRLFTGLDINQLSPRDVIGQIAPRPILLIYGSREISLPGARRQQTAAGSNAELWVVEGAGHGNYFVVAPAEYEARLVSFFDQALREK